MNLKEKTVIFMLVLAALVVLGGCGQTDSTMRDLKRATDICMMAGGRPVLAYGRTTGLGPSRIEYIMCLPPGPDKRP